MTLNIAVMPGLFGLARRQRELGEIIGRRVDFKTDGLIGEAANHVNPTTLARLDGLPRRDMIDMRTVVIHASLDIELETVWETVVDDLPAVVDILRAKFDRANSGGC